MPADGQKIPAAKFNVPHVDSLLTIFNSSPTAQSITRLSDGLVLEINDMFCALTGRTRADLVGRLATDGPFVWANAAERKRVVALVKRQGLAQNIRIGIRTAAGELRDARVSFRAVAYAGQQCLLASALDVTEEVRTANELACSEERYRSLIMNMPAGVQHGRVIFDGSRAVDYEILHVNPAHEAVVGMRGLEGQRVSDAFPGFLDKNAEVLKRIGDVASNGRPQRWDQFEPIRNRWFDLSLFRPAAGEYVAVVTDITQRKRDEQQLAETAGTLKAALDSMTDPVFITDTTGRFVQFNEAFANFHRSTDHEAIPAALVEYTALFEVYRPDGTLLPPDQWVIARALRGESGSNVEYHVRHRGNGASWVISHGFAPIRDASGGVTGSVVIVRDVTQQKRIEEALRNVSLVVEQSAESVVITDLDDNIQYVNEAFVRKSGYQRSDVMGKSPTFLRSGKHPSDLYDKIRREVRDGNTWSGELVNRRRDGTEYIDHTVIRALRHYDGSINYYVAIAEDVTERKQLESAVLDAADRERQKLGRDLHDGLGQELTGLSLMLSAVARETKKAGDATTADKIAALAAAAGQCIKTARQISHGLMPLEFAGGDLGLSLERLIDATRGTAPELRVTLDDSDSCLRQLRLPVAEAGYRIVQEALTNAIRHGGATIIAVKVQRDGDQLRLRVEDNGSGLPTDRAGDGMGLKIMQFRAREAGGTVTFENTRSGGAAVCCAFPLTV